ncbi:MULTISPECIES: hypothetical protein [Klebsiella]|nr:MULTISPECIES: hypothetical protein [Klebsiella]MDV1904732.1 hypothetical protein [Klebsiella pasteurii]MDV1910676.1 hypothetical protein [Klebsiella pasteurii]QJM21931.1 hypothetical protein HJW76_16130 [Klebsiella pneumoniae]
MAGIGYSVRKSIDDFEIGDLDGAMMHACNAFDGTSRKLHPEMRKHHRRFTQSLREHYDIFGPMALPNINLETTFWPAKVSDQQKATDRPDIADLVYCIHRCTHGHGDELPEGFELIPDATNKLTTTSIIASAGKIRLSDRTIFGLLGIAVLCPENSGLRIPDGYNLTFAGQVLMINDWWGRAEDFKILVEKQNLISVKLDFEDWCNELN